MSIATFSLKSGVDHNVLSLEIHACLAVALTSHAGTSKGLRIAKSADSCLVTGTTYKVKSEVLEKVGGKLELGLRHRCGLTARHHNQPPNKAQAERLQLGRWR